MDLVLLGLVGGKLMARLNVQTKFLEIPFESQRSIVSVGVTDQPQVNINYHVERFGSEILIREGAPHTFLQIFS